MRKFASPARSLATELHNDHGGIGCILFQRVLAGTDFQSAIDFVDYTVIPPGSTIGRHEHHGNEEIYFIASGSPLMRVDGEEARLQIGNLSVVRNGEWHELINDTDCDVEILVIQVGLR
jgi:mannose-6-phosphate isomerase-like protein (cupin superfamily)